MASPVDLIIFTRPHMRTHEATIVLPKVFVHP